MAVKYKKRVGFEGQVDMFLGQSPLSDRSTLRSALQKAYRRNDQEMLIWALEWCWQDDPTWVARRALILSAEDNWKGTLEVGRAMHKVESLLASKNPVVRAKAKGIVFEALSSTARSKKNQDGNGMRDLAYQVRNRPKKERQALTKAIRDRVPGPAFSTFETLVRYGEVVDEKKFVPQEIWSEVWDRVNAQEHKEGRTKEQYMELRDLVGACYFRNKKGGGIETRMMFLSVCLLALEDYESGTYGYAGSLQPPSSPAALLTDTKGEKRADPSEGLAPWYCTDMHTPVGKRVLGYAAKVIGSKVGMDKEVFEAMWFVLETARVNQQDPTSIWWDLSNKAYFLHHGFKMALVLDIWADAVKLIKTKVKAWVAEELETKS